MQLQPLSEHKRGGIGEVSKLALPIILTQLSNSLMHVVDSAMVGRLGAVELAAVGFGGIGVWTFQTLFVGTATGIQTFVAQAHGANQEDRTGGWVWQGLVFLLPLCLVALGPLLLSLNSLLTLLAPPQEMRDAAEPYIRTRLLGTPGLVTAMSLAAFFRGLGDTRTPFLVALFANGLNALLDYALIFGNFGFPNWGVQGAGAATACAHTVEALILMALFLRPKIRARFGSSPQRPRSHKIKRFAILSSPIGGQWFLEMTSFTLFSALIARMGTAPMAASQALIALLSLSFMQAIGISMASATLVGRYIGAGNQQAARRSHRSSLQLGALLCIGFGSGFFFVPEPLLRIFTNDPQVVQVGIVLLRMGAFLQLADALQLITAGSLRGAGDTRWPFAVQTAMAWGLYLPLVYLTAVQFDTGVAGAWLACLLYLFILAALFLRRFETGAWKDIQLTTTSEQTEEHRT